MCVCDRLRGSGSERVRERGSVVTLLVESERRFRFNDSTSDAESNEIEGPIGAAAAAEVASRTCVLMTCDPLSPCVAAPPIKTRICDPVNDAPLEGLQVVLLPPPPLGLRK